jgi:hypothetical protein
MHFIDRNCYIFPVQMRPGVGAKPHRCAQRDRLEPELSSTDVYESLGAFLLSPLSRIRRCILVNQTEMVTL